MISLNVKAESKTSSPIGLLDSKVAAKEPTLSFSELLKGVKSSNGDKEIQNGSFVLDLGTSQEDIKDVKLLGKKDSLLALLKNDSKLITQEQVQKTVSVLEFNPKVTQNMSTDELKTLIQDAKQFLKNKIITSDDFKMAQVKDLPKTLKGLSDMAKSFGIDMSKITLEEVRSTPTKLPITNNDGIEKNLQAAIKETVKPEIKENLQAAIKETVKPEIKENLQAAVKETVKPESKENLQAAIKETVKPESKENPQAAIKETVKPESKENPQAAIKETVKPESKENPQAAIKETVKPESKENPQAAIKETVKPESKENLQAAIKETVKPEIKENLQAAIKETVKETVKETIKFNDNRVDTVREMKATPLFKAQEKTELTTEQIVQTKQFKVEDKTPKSRADETLKLLLRGEKPTSPNITTTADFSVATARVIAPSASSEVSKSLEQLLHGTPDESTSKVDGLATHKTDSFEVKLNEAKQMIKYLSQDVKTAIEDYKSPFTRVKVQLNPHKLGEVDVTIVQRGKNLHVNISSNTAAINTLAMNANELKTQLNTSGIQNASLNFNNSEQNSEQQASQQQQKRQNEREADEEYNYFSNEEQNEEVLSSLEIVVPSYA